MNRELIIQVRDFLKANPDKHDQQEWCGTRQCFAGWACHFEGWRPLTAHERELMDDIDFEQWPGMADTCVKNAGCIEDVETLARQLLGLDQEQANRLFFSASRAELFHEIEELLK